MACDGEHEWPDCGEVGCWQAEHTTDVRMAHGTIPPPDLTEKLTESLMWINIRVKLGLMLQEQADKGDQVARDQLNFLARTWPTGGVPRQHEHALTEQLIRNLGDLVIRSIEGHTAAQKLIEEAIIHGVDIPRHLMESR